MSVEIPKAEIYPPNFLNRLNSARVEAFAIQKFLEQQGGRGVVLGNGGKADLEKFSKQAFWGCGLKIR